MTRVVIDRLRIQGLQGRAPTQREVEAALRQALGARAPMLDPTGAPPNQRVTRPAGTSLAGAAQAAADAAFGPRRR